MSLSPDSSQPPRAASRELFKNRAYEELHARLHNCQYEPGAFLSERQLAAELGMSKTPIKAALERLEAEGYIVVSPQSGIRVRELSETEVAELYDVRVALECFVLKSVTGNLTGNQLQRWEDNLQAMTLVAENPANRRQVVDLDTEFHALPSEFLGNQEIVKLMQQYSQRIRMVTVSVFTRLPYRAAQSLAEHRQILDAVRQGDAIGATTLLESHIRMGQKLLREALHARVRR